METEIKKENAGNVDGFTDKDIKYINKEIRSPSDLLVLADQLEQFKKGLRPLMPANYENFTLGIAKSQDYVAACLRSETITPQRQILEGWAERIQHMKQDVEALHNGTFDCKTYQTDANDANYRDENGTATEVVRDADDELYFPGVIHIVDVLKAVQHFRTIPEIGTDRESVYGFNGQIYVRAEEHIKEVAHLEFIRQWTDMHENAKKLGNRALLDKLSNCLNRGPTSGEIEEVLAMIRRTTFTKDQMNPPSHIPFKNGLLNLKTRMLEPFSFDLFYTYQIDANLLSDKYITLKDTPMFEELLRTAFYDADIPMILSYFAYTFYPGLPAHRVLFILGRERIGKGTSVRVLQGLMPRGSGSMSLARMLTSERFQFTGIEGKNLLIDAETKRNFRRGTVLDWSAFCNLFGGDTLSLENKGREARDYLSIAKGIVLANLPFIPVDSAPAIARALVVETKNERPKREVKDLHKLILESERDQIATLLMEILFKLIDRDFNFPGQLTDESTAEIMEQLADPVSFFVDDETEYVEGSQTLVDDAYKGFIKWCRSKGITELPRQTFVKRMARNYHKKKLGGRGMQAYFFLDCKMNNEMNNGDPENEESQGRLQVGYGGNHPESPKLSVSGERYRRSQHAYTNLRVAMRGETIYNDHVHVKDDVHKLATGNNGSRNPEIGHPRETEPVANLHDTSNSDSSNDNSSLQENSVNNDVFNTKPPNTTTNELNQSYLMEKTVIDTIKKIMSTNKNSKIGTAEILNNWLSGITKPSFKELDEKIIPTMAASGLLTLHNGTVERTSKQMPDPSQSSQPSDSSALTHLLITQDIPEFAWTDGDWKLRKNDDAYVPLELAKTLINRGWATEIQKPSGRESTTNSTTSNPIEDNKQEEPKNPTPITTEPISKEQGDKAVQVLHERGIHLNGADTGVSVYGDKYNIAVPVNFYRQNAERVDQIMNELGFSKGNTGQLHNVFFDKPMKGAEAQ